MKLKNLLISSFVAIGLLLTGCSEESNMKTDEIITKVLAADQEIKEYYAEAEMKMYENDELVENNIIEESRSEDGKIKIVVKDKETNEELSFSVNDGETITFFNTSENMAMVMEDVGTLDVPNQSMREQITTLIENLKESHEYEYVGEEKVNDFNTHHIKLKPKEKNTIFGEIELWVDQKTWFPVKSIGNSGNVRSENVYTVIDTAPKFTDDTFTIALPDDVEIVDLEEKFQENEGTIEEAEEKLGTAFLVLNEENLTVEKVEIYEFDGEINRTEIAITYKNEEGLPLVNLSVFPTPEEYPIEESNLKIRGQNAEVMKEINAYTWDEDGLRYTLIVEDINSTITEEDVLKMTENMDYSS